MASTKIIRLEDVVSEDVKWLWEPYIPAGKLTIIRGNPGDGKTMLLLMLISKLSTGTPLPGEPEGTKRKPCACIYQTAEDGLADTVKPRLTANGADCTLVHSVDESRMALSFADDRIEEAIERTGAKLFVLDPLQAYLGHGVDMYRANEVRPQFHNLMNIADRTGCAIVLIEHMNKIKGLKAINKGLGSMDITGAARSVLLLAKPKPKEPYVYLAPIKNNLAALGETLVFTVEEGRMYYEGTSELSADDLLAAGKPEFNDTKLSQAEETLERLLADGKRESAKNIFELFKGVGISKRTVNEAKKNLGIKSANSANGWQWYLPEDGNEEEE